LVFLAQKELESPTLRAMCPTQSRRALGVKKGIEMAVALSGQVPGFSLPSDSGSEVSSSGLKGKAAVIFFYPKDDTTGCTLEAKDFSDRLAEFEKIGVSVAGISPDSIKSHRKFRAKHELSVTLLSDESKEMIAACGLWVEKSMYGRKYMGVERTTLLLDPTGKVSRIWEKVSVPGHAQEVLEAARELTAQLRK
jgi:thioredoxin-dependent peroxiredoxin